MLMGWLIRRYADRKQAERIWREAARIAGDNTYMSKDCLLGGHFGGPGCCEYGCGKVLAEEFERRAKDVT